MKLSAYVDRHGKIPPLVRQNSGATPTPVSKMKLPLKLKNIRRAAIGFCTFFGLIATMTAQIGTRFPSEKKIVADPVTGIPLTFLTSKPVGDSKIYQTHHQWSADGKWVIFRSNRVHGQAMAVNEETGTIVQVTEGGYTGMLCLADHSMNLYFLRLSTSGPAPVLNGPEQAY